MLAKSANLNVARVYIRKLLLLIVAVQILNLSVYGGDFDQYYFTRHEHSIGDFNEIDSLIEYVTEVVLNYKDAFPENGAHNENTSHSLLLKHISFKLIETPQQQAVPTYQASVPLFVPLKEDYKFLFFKEINPPPPKA